MDEITEIVNFIISKKSPFFEVRNKYWAEQDLWKKIDKVVKADKLGNLQCELATKEITMEITPWFCDPCYKSEKDGDIYTILKKGHENPNVRLNLEIERRRGNEDRERALECLDHWRYGNL